MGRTRRRPGEFRTDPAPSCRVSAGAGRKVPYGRVERRRGSVTWPLRRARRDRTRRDHGARPGIAGAPDDRRRPRTHRDRRRGHTCGNGMVMVGSGLGDLVPAGLTGEIHLREPAFPQQVLDRPVHRCDPDPAHPATRRAQHLPRPQGACRDEEGLLNCLSLTRVPDLGICMVKEVLSERAQSCSRLRRYPRRRLTPAPPSAQTALLTSK